MARDGLRISRRWLISIGVLLLASAIGNAVLGHLCNTTIITTPIRIAVIVLVGLFLAQTVLLSVGVVLLKAPFWSRFLVHWVLVSLLMAAFFLGMFLPAEEIPPPSEILAVCLSIPVVACAFQTPFWGMRIFRHWRLCFPECGSSFGGEKTSIADLLVGTAILAMSMGAVRWAAAESSDYWLEVGMISATASAISIFAGIPATWCFLTSQSLVAGYWLWISYTVAICLSIIAATATIQSQVATSTVEFWQTIGTAMLVITMLGSLSIALSVGLLLCRWLGLRLKSKKNDATPAHSSTDGVIEVQPGE